MGIPNINSDISESDMPLIKVKRSLKHERHKLIQPICDDCNFSLSCRPTLAGIRKGKSCLTLLLLVRVISQILHTEEKT